jgi:hypothetical protein
MPNISFTGLGSSIDFGLVRDAIVAERMRPISLLQAKSVSYGNKSDALKQLNGVWQNLTNTAQALTDSSLGRVAPPRPALLRHNCKRHFRSDFGSYNQRQPARQQTFSDFDKLSNCDFFNSRRGAATAPSN